VCNVETLRPDDYDQVFNLIGYPIQEGYPEKPMRKHLLNYFADEMGLEVGQFPRVNLPKPVVPFKSGKPYATLQRFAGWSNYKMWYDVRWEEVCGRLQAAGIPIVFIDEKMGLPLATSIALIANAAMHIGVDSFGNHVSHIYQVPSVILWGSTQWHAAGYPHNFNISKGLECQPCFRETHPGSLHPRGPCPNGHACMQQISVDEVVDACVTLWDCVTAAESLA
jgi:ADP-heptose:LPS heptosyltransferase